MSTHLSVGLALGSGGYRGFAHIGVIKSLVKNKIPIDYLSGCSSGALVAAHYARFKDVVQLEQDLLHNRRDQLFALLDLNWTGGLISGQKLTVYLEKKLQNSYFKSLKIPLRIIATNISNGKLCSLNQGKVAPAVRASISVPLIFKPFLYQGKLLADGGLSDPVPGDSVRKMGADFVIGVNLYNKKEFIVRKFTLSKVLRRAAAIILYNLSQNSAANCDIVIEPDTSHFARRSNMSKYFTQEIAEQIMLIGERATDKMIPRIKAKLKL